MSSYATVEDVLARMGKLRGVVGNNDAPDESEIERFIEDLSANVDVLFGHYGAAVPITDATTLGALRPVVADAAAVLALEGAFPGGPVPAEVSDLIDRITARRDAAWKSISDGTSPIVVVIEDEAGSALGASSFWTDEPEYGIGMTDQARLGLNPALAPYFERTERF